MPGSIMLKIQLYLPDHVEFQRGNFRTFEKKSHFDMKELSVADLKIKMDRREDFQLIDVREPHEYEAANIGGKLIPLSTILENQELISREKQVIVHCKGGVRSAAAIFQLESKFGFTNLYNLKGGILAYAKEVDPSLNVI